MNTARRNTIAAPKPQPPRLTPERLSDELGALLSAMTRCYTKLHEANTEQRESVRKAHTERLAAATATQERIVAEIGVLDTKRRELVALACSGFTELRMKPAASVTLSDLALAAPEGSRAELLDRAASLRTLIKSVQSQNSSMRSVAQGLLTHVESVLRQVAMTLSHSGTYGPRGYVEAGGSVTTSLDLCS